MRRTPSSANWPLAGEPERASVSRVPSMNTCSACKQRFSGELHVPCVVKLGTDWVDVQTFPVADQPVQTSLPRISAPGAPMRVMGFEIVTSSRYVQAGTCTVAPGSAALIND